MIGRTFGAIYSFCCLIIGFVIVAYTALEKILFSITDFCLTYFHLIEMKFIMVESLKAKPTPCF